MCNLVIKYHSNLSGELPEFYFAYLAHKAIKIVSQARLMGKDTTALVQIQGENLLCAWDKVPTNYKLLTP